MRILFAGSPHVALPSLHVAARHADCLAIMSQPDRPVGRKKILTPTPVSSWAIEHAVELFRPENADELREQVAGFAPDVAIAVAFGRILGPTVLSLPSAGWWNVHFSLLPRWRGAAPVQNALWAGDSVTGVTLFQLDEGLDTGPVLSQETHPIEPGITSGELLSQLGEVGAALLDRALSDLARGNLSSSAQEGQPSHAPKPSREMGRVRAADSWEVATRRFQAFTPEPGCFFTYDGGNKTVRVVDARGEPTRPPGDIGEVVFEAGQVRVICADGSLVLHRVVPAGKPPMAAADWARGLATRVRIDG